MTTVDLPLKLTKSNDQTQHAAVDQQQGTKHTSSKWQMLQTS